MTQDRFIRFSIASALTFGCVSKQTYIGGSGNAEPEPEPDTRIPAEPVPKPAEESPDPQGDAPAPAGEGEPDDPPAEDDPLMEQSCSASVLALDRAPTPYPIEIYCTGSPGRSTLFLDLVFDNVSGMALSKVATLEGWRIVFANDGSLIEELDLMVIGGGPWDLARDEGSGDTWYAAAHEQPYSASVCARCDDEIAVEAYFTSDEVGCIQATTEVGTLYCR